MKWVIYKMSSKGEWIEVGEWLTNPQPYFIENEELNERYMFVEKVGQ